MTTAGGGGGGCYAGDYEPSSPLMLPLTDCCGGSGSPAWSQWQKEPSSWCDMREALAPR